MARTSSKYVAFLRGINVGGRIIRMTDLRACFLDMGFSEVSTTVQSGNVVFDAGTDDVTSLVTKIEAGVSTTFNYPARAFVYSLDTLRKIVDAYSFDLANKEYQHYVVFLEQGLEDDLAAGAGSLHPKLEEIAKGNDVIYWKVLKGFTVKSDFSKQLTKAIYKDFHTVRNLNTLEKILA